MARKKVVKMKQKAAAEENAVIRIQAAQRGRSGRQYVANLKQEQQKQHIAATKIQAVQRGRLARKEVAALRMQHNERLGDSKSKVNWEPMLHSNF